MLLVVDALLYVVCVCCVVLCLCVCVVLGVRIVFVSCVHTVV